MLGRLDRSIPKGNRMTYANWRRRLEISQTLKTVAARREAVALLKINFSQPGEADEGYYRKPITEKDHDNGRNVVVGWIPVAYYMWEGKLTGVIGAGDKSHEMSDHEIFDEELWSYVVSNPIPHEWYVAVAERGEPWPDAKPTTTMAVLRAFEKSLGERGGEGEFLRLEDNEPPKPEKVESADPPEVQHAKAIDTAISAAKSLTVTNEGEASIAAGSKNRIAELRLAADKAGKAIYQPLHAAYVAEREKWLPMVNRADVAEKSINREVLEFREKQRKAVIAAEMKAAQAQREQDEANERAAQRAIAAGEPEPAPLVEEAAIAAAPSPVVPTYGKRSIKEDVKKFAVIVDDVEVYKWLRANQELKDLLQKLATNAIRAGFTVPGATIREGLI